MPIEKIREGLYIKKGFDGYRVVYPYKKDDGSIWWFNIVTGGSMGNLFKTLLVVFLIILMVWSYQRDIREYKIVNDYYLKHPCEFCEIMTSGSPIQKQIGGINISIFNNMLNKTGEVNGSNQP